MKSLYHYFKCDLLLPSLTGLLSKEVFTSFYYKILEPYSMVCVLLEYFSKFMRNFDQYECNNTSPENSEKIPQNKEDVT